MRPFGIQENGDNAIVWIPTYPATGLKLCTVRNTFGIFLRPNTCTVANAPRTVFQLFHGYL